jgi:cobalt/nickel transport system permease protein
LQEVCMKIPKLHIQFKTVFWLLLALLLSVGIRPALAQPARMHIMEGYLPLGWCIFWWVAAVPFWVVGFNQVSKLISDKPGQRIMLGLAGGFIFVLSALKIPSVTGSSSHPTGTGLGTMLFGPFITAILGTLVLILQALLMAHGGISTLGANSVSMAIGGPLVAYYLVWLPLKGKTPTWLSVGLTAFVADLVTYVITSTELALAFPNPVTGFVGSWLTFAGIFAVTQIPLAVGEGILVVLIFNAMQSSASVELKELGLEGV